MVYYFSDEYYEDNSENDDDFNEEELQEIEENRKLIIISKFKEYIQKEPEFYGIRNISAIEILNILNTKFNSSNNSKFVTVESLDIFDDMYQELFGYSDDFSVYLNKMEVIFSKIYV